MRRTKRGDSVVASRQQRTCRYLYTSSLGFQEHIRRTSHLLIHSWKNRQYLMQRRTFSLGGTGRPLGLKIPWSLPVRTATVEVAFRTLSTAFGSAKLGGQRSNRRHFNLHRNPGRAFHKDASHELAQAQLAASTALLLRD